MRGSSFVSAGSGLRIGTADKLRDTPIRLGMPDRCLARNLFYALFAVQAGRALIGNDMGLGKKISALPWSRIIEWE